MTLATLVLMVAPLVALGACIVVHVVLSRALPGLPRPRGIMLSVGAAAVGVAGLALFGPAERLPAGLSPLELAAFARSESGVLSSRAAFIWERFHADR